MPSQQLLQRDALPEVVLNIPLVEQLDASWCWAACLEMLYTYAGWRDPATGKAWQQADFVALYRQMPLQEVLAFPPKAGIGLLSLERLLRYNLGHQDLKIEQGLALQSLLDQFLQRRLPVLIAVERYGQTGLPNHLVLLYGLILDPEPTVLVRDPGQKNDPAGTNLTRLALTELEGETYARASFFYPATNSHSV